MILVCGIPTEAPVAKALAHLEAVGVDVVMFNQRHFDRTALSFTVDRGEVEGTLVLDDRAYPLSDFTAAYVRLMDDRFLPELQDEPTTSTRRLACRGLHDGLMRWLDMAPGRVVNRLGKMGSNGSKPYQAQLIGARGFEVPETLITNDPRSVEQFVDQHRRVIYKSVSGIRSIVTELVPQDRARLELVRGCPTQFQAYVPGTDIRVHTIGQRVFSTRVTTTGIDYRYAASDETELVATELPDELNDRCIRLSADLGLVFAGIDLRITDAGQVYCFEVNPCPAYSYYEAHTGQPIARALADYLTRRRGLRISLRSL